AFPIDSPYDFKTLHVRTSRVTVAEFGSAVVRVTDRAGVPIQTQPEIYLPIKITPSQFKTTLFVVGIAALVLSQQYLSASAKGPVPAATTITLGVLAFVTAFVVVFGLKKPMS